MIPILIDNQGRENIPCFECGLYLVWPVSADTVTCPKCGHVVGIVRGGINVR